MENKIFQMDIKLYAESLSCKNFYDIKVETRTITFEEKHAYTTLYEIKYPNYPVIKEALLEMAFKHTRYLGIRPRYSAFITLSVEKDDKSGFEFIESYTINFEPEIILGDFGINVIESKLWRNE